MIDSSKAVGLVMGLAAAVIGGGWQVATRAATTATQMAPADIALLRYGIPALLLAPVWWRLVRGSASPRPGAADSGADDDLPQRRTAPRWLLLLLMWAGAGLPFGLLAMVGSTFAPPAHMGVLMAGASPLFATALAFVIWRERPGRGRAFGLVLMTLAVGLLSAKSLGAAAGAGVATGAGTWRGDVLFLLAAGLWATYGLVYRRTGLSPWQAAAAVNAASAVVVVLWVVQRGGTGLTAVPAASLAWQALWQGVFAGVLGLWTYSVAITRLGAAQAAAFGALAPAVSALGGWWWLGDALGAIDGAAVAAAVAGVVMASGALGDQGQTSNHPRKPRAA